MKKNKREPDYHIFHEWFKENGGKAGNISFPAKFGPTQYVGIQANQDIRANKVILAIPKKLIISLSLVRQSQIGKVCQKYRILNDIDNQQTDFNILALYLIWQKQLQKESFFYPYLQCISSSQTILDWSLEDIEKMKEPTITQQYINFLKKDFPDVFQVFVEISVQNPELFKSVITWEEFMECYSIVMTRCFGWGLPETMLVPFADFLNHSDHGVNHYTFNKKLEESNHQSYIKKKEQLNLSILGIDNQKNLPASYARNKREAFIYSYRQILQQKNRFYDENLRLNNKQTRQQLDFIHQELLIQNFNHPLYASSDSEDNDSEPDDNICGENYKEHEFIKHINKLVQKQIQPNFECPKPYANRQFLEGVDFSWWHEEDENQSYFIVCSESEIKKGQQIFNSYGRRSNRFLLVWYGFTLFNNKYDSIPFRILSDKIFQKTGKLVYVQNLIAPFFHLGSEKYGYESLSEEYRLKKNRICYKLMAFLRRRVIKKFQIYKELYIKKLITIHEIKNFEIQKLMFDQYQFILRQLTIVFAYDYKRQRLSEPHRDYFCHLLISSNQQILQTQLKLVYILRQIIENLMKGASLNEAYRLDYLEEEKNPDIKVQNRKKILDYFKMLAKWEKIKKN